MKKEVLKYENIRYAVYRPTDGVTAKGVILHLHGAGGRGKDISLVQYNPLMKYAYSTDGEFPFVIVSPQCEYDSWFDIFEQLQNFAEHIKKEENAENYFLSGISMGGYTAWQLLESLPDLFKKAIICCGGGMYWNAGRINAEVHAYHGKKDESVFFDESVRMVERMKASGKKAEVVLYENAEHNCWDVTYGNPETYKFLYE